MEPYRYSPFDKNSCFRLHNPENNVTQQNTQYHHRDEEYSECDIEEEAKMMFSWFGIKIET